MVPEFDRVLVSCEHAGNRVPAWLRPAFASAGPVLASHRGWDPGTRELGRQLARHLACPLHRTSVSRLVVDCNRSRHHPRLFSQWTRDLDAASRQRILAEHWQAHRQPIEDRLRAWCDAGLRCLHLAMHSFTPVLHGVDRRCDLALLYDPGRAAERGFCAALLDDLAARRPGLRLRRNHPYRGTADGLATHLRQQLPRRLYAGIEIECSQAWSAEPGERRRIGAILVQVLAANAPPARP